MSAIPATTPQRPGMIGVFVRSRKQTLYVEAARLDACLAAFDVRWPTAKAQHFDAPAVAAEVCAQQMPSTMQDPFRSQRYTTCLLSVIGKREADRRARARAQVVGEEKREHQLTLGIA